ncbi:hypothetical protein MFIFM68171_05537 [Madurella fahalii]|uniref:Uncharacterized protein n=1 Tax=Madurella fahalii TaxID=1157608 RepID=A0ABQ0GC49_9PEZI
MSDIIEAIKDALNPSRREQATVETYDANTRGPYAHRNTAGDGQPELSAPSEAQHPARAEQNDLTGAGGSITSRAVKMGRKSDVETRTAPDGSPALASDTGFGAPEGTYGPHKSRVANALDPRVDSDRDGRPSHGLSDYGGVAAKPVYKEGGKYGLS